MKLHPVKSEKPYEIEVYLDVEAGEGGSCTVFLGKRNSLDVIIKKMKSKDFLEVEQEQKRYNELTNINKNHTLVSFDIYKDNEDTLYKVQQVNDGKIWLDEHSPVSNSTLYDTLKTIKSLLEIVSSYHDNNILLMDITPDNIFVQKNENRVMLFDLDASVNINDIDTLKSLSSKRYFAPHEIINFPRNSKNIGTCSDLYMVANCLYYRLFGRPYTGSLINPKLAHQSLSLINFKNDGKFKDRTEVYSEIQNLLIEFFKKAFRLNKRDRFQNAEEMGLAIDNIIYSIKHPHRIENVFHKTTDKTIGREKEIEAIKKSFNDKYHITVLRGTGGIGKTSIAYKFAESSSGYYDHIYQIDYSTSLIDTVLNKIDISNYSYEDVTASDEKKYKEKFEKLQNIISQTNSRMLLIIDNMNNGKDEKFIDLRKLGCDILITTRNKFIQSSQKTIEIDLIDDMDTAIQIFRTYYTIPPKNLTKENTIIEEIINKVGKLPLILRLLASATQNSTRDLIDIRNSLLNENFIYPVEEIEYDKDGNVITASVDEILEFIFDLNNLMDDKDNKNILRCMSLMPYAGILKSDLKKMLGLKDLNKVNRLISISIIQEDSTGIIYLHQVISDLLRKNLNPNCTNCKKMFVYLKEISSNYVIASLAEYNYIKNIFLFVHDVFPNKRKHNKTYAYYELAVAKSMVIFNDFTTAKKHLQIIIDKNVDEYTVYSSYQYLLAIAVDLREYSITHPILEKFDSWDDFKKYPEIHIGVNDSRGWEFMFMPKETEEGCLNAIELFENIFKEYKMTTEHIKDTFESFSANDFSSHVEGKFLRMLYSLALAHYNVAKHYKGAESRSHYIQSKELLNAVINRREGMPEGLNSKALHERNILAQCYGKLGDVVKARDAQKSLIIEKLKFSSELTHTVATSYRNLVLSQNVIYQNDTESNYEDLIYDLAKLNFICKKINLHEFNATYYDVWFQICIKTNNVQLLYDKLKEFYEYISDNYENTNFYAKTYNNYSYKNITKYIDKNGLLDQPLEVEILDLYEKCNTFLS